MQRIVLDTNVLVSATLFNGSIPHRAFLKARADAVLLATEETLAEFRAVLLLEKFDKHFGWELRKAAIEEYAQQCAMVPVARRIRVCRDPRDDKFLEAAVHGNADAIITGDRDLLVLDAFHGIRIVTPAAFLDG